MGVLVWWYRAGQIDFETADREQLFRWLVVHDLAAEPLQRRRQLATRLDQEFCEQIDWEAIARQLNACHREQLWRNLPFILEPWFLDKVDRYHACEPSRRRVLLDQMLDTMTEFGGLEKLGPQAEPTDEGKAVAPGLEGMLFEEIEVWRSRAEPDQQARIDQFVAAVQTRWLYRQSANVLRDLKSLWSKPKSK